LPPSSRRSSTRSTAPPGTASSAATSVRGPHQSAPFAHAALTAALRCATGAAPLRCAAVAQRAGMRGVARCSAMLRCREPTLARIMR
jgi:hypothetical protein